MALGARRHEILWLTARLGLLLTVAGVVIGLAVAAGATRYLQSLLYRLGGKQHAGIGLDGPRFLAAFDELDQFSDNGDVVIRIPHKMKL
jgi:ABC-type antimicrobial peptide transport system permease subunit